MKIMLTALVSSLVMATITNGVFDLSAIGTVASYVVSGQVVLGAALVAAIVLNTKT